MKVCSVYPSYTEHVIRTRPQNLGAYTDTGSYAMCNEATKECTLNSQA